MSEKVIIDSVDVSGCEFYDNGCCRECDMRVPFYSDIYCDDKCNRDCTYKQLQRTKEENERLKKQKDILLAQLVINDGEDVTVQISQSQFDEYNKLLEENERLKKALEEIRDIAENYFEECGVPDDYFKRNNYSWKQHQIKGLTCKLQQILDKINEVLKEGE